MDEKVPEEGKKEEVTAGGPPAQETGGPGKEAEKPSGEELYDAIIPVGTPRSVIREVLKRYPVQLVERKLPVYIGNMEGEEREILAFRGPLPVVEEVEKYIREQLAVFAETGGWKDREKKPS
ncbi:MAG: hypothetical protein LUO86_02125 [Methanomicrobiales archaeon]|nr:hypothetical protein [Methanomicrobiales archaeon]MDD1655021.1 hypothetical protein [Methanomicrobiales archaeon]